MNTINEIIKTPMSGDDILNYLPNCKIISYNDLEYYKNINDLLINDKSHCIILYETSKNEGHWCSIYKSKNTINFFDPYGGIPDSQLGYINCKQRKPLNQSHTYLTDLFNKFAGNIFYNDVDYQNETDKDVSTCGRHCVYNLKCFLNDNMQLDKYYHHMFNLKKKYKKSYDVIVSTIIK
jgi:hypothetical protein